jgi:hypothetical protein
MLGAKRLICLDVLDKDETKFPYESDSVSYFKVSDTYPKRLPDYYFDYCFSFGTFCHCSFDILEDYAHTLFSKFQRDSNFFWMVAEKTKFEAATGTPMPSNEWTWYDTDLDRLATMLTNVGYKIKDKDVGTCLRDPIIWFTK